MSKPKLALLVALVGLAASTPAAASFISELPACTGSIDPHVDNGCRMNSYWYHVPYDLPGTQPMKVHANSSLSGRALAPIGAHLLGARMRYVVTFRAKESSDWSLQDMLHIEAFVGDDKGEVTSGGLEIISRKTSADLVTLEIEGARVSFQPHYLYVNLTRANHVFGHIEVKDLEIGIVPAGR